MKLVLVLALLLAACTAVAATGAEAAYPRACGVIPAGGKRWYTTIDGASCATAKTILRRIAAKAKGSKDNTSIDLGVQAGMKCGYQIFSGNAGISCTGGAKYMRANWVH